MPVGAYLDGGGRGRVRGTVVAGRTYGTEGHTLRGVPAWQAFNWLHITGITAGMGDVMVRNCMDCR